MHHTIIFMVIDSPMREAVSLILRERGRERERENMCVVLVLVSVRRKQIRWRLVGGCVKRESRQLHV